VQYWHSMYAKIQLCLYIFMDINAPHIDVYNQSINQSKNFYSGLSSRATARTTSAVTSGQVLQDCHVLLV